MKTLRVRVYYEDTDAGGVVYHARYLCFMERARSEFLHDHGFNHHRLEAQFRCQFVVRTMTLDFKKPARLDDQLVIVSTAVQKGRTSLLFAQQVQQTDEVPPTPLCTAQCRVVCVDTQTFRPIAIPAELIAALPLGPH